MISCALSYLSISILKARQLVVKLGEYPKRSKTNFGELFKVETKPNPSDLAYTDVALASHTDNPYRDPVPGIQYLHCLKNEVSGGLSTLVDGMAILKPCVKESD